MKTWTGRYLVMISFWRSHESKASWANSMAPWRVMPKKFECTECNWRPSATFRRKRTPLLGKYSNKNKKHSLKNFVHCIFVNPNSPSSNHWIKTNFYAQMLLNCLKISKTITALFSPTPARNNFWENSLQPEASVDPWKTRSRISATPEMKDRLQCEMKC